MTSIKRKYVLGEAVFNGTDSKKTHVGWICGFMPNGDPLVVEAQGLKYGVVVRLLKKRSFKYRGLMTKKFKYEEVEPDEPVKPVDPSTFVFTRQLKYGIVGEDVKELKKLLNKQNLGTDLTITNPNFLGTTRRVVRLAQKALGIKVDGIAGPITISALGGTFKA
jgi:murein L,D-transpeptidase YcbB/YkuD